MLDRQGHSTLVLGRGNYAAQVLHRLDSDRDHRTVESQDVLVPVVTPVDFFVLAMILFVIATSVICGRPCRL